VKPDRRTITLGVVAVLAVAAATTATIAGHRHKHSPERAAVGDYVRRANAIENDMQVPLSHVLLAYRDFTKPGGTTKGVTIRLAAAAVTFERLQRRLARLEAPPEAATLRKRLLSLVAQQVAVTREVRAMAVFAPPYASALTQSRAAAAAFSRALRSVTVPTPRKLKGTRAEVAAAQRKYGAESNRAAASQADAVDAYDRAVGAVIGKLRGLHPPLAYAAGYRAQLRSLTDVVAAGDRLALELRKPQRSNVALLSRRLTISAREAQTLAAQRAQNASIDAYNAKVEAMSTATTRVQGELLRLQRTLP
jgi:hypothetical protein